MSISLAYAVNKQKNIASMQLKTPDEDEVFEEVGKVLKKFGLEKKYGLALLHKHFDLDEDEILVEYTDIERRTLISSPLKVDKVDFEKLVETVWCLDENSATTVCVVFCHSGHGQHVGKHEAR